MPRKQPEKKINPIKQLAPSPGLPTYRELENLGLVRPVYQQLKQ